MSETAGSLPRSLASRRCGMRGNRQLQPGLADQSLELIKTRDADFGPTLACEKLEEIHGLFLGKETVNVITRALSPFLLLMALADDGPDRKGKNPSVH